MTKEERKEYNKKYNKEYRLKLNVWKQYFKTLYADRKKPRKKVYKPRKVYQKRYQKYWRVSNTDKRVMYRNNRRCLELSAKGSYTTKQWYELKESFKFMCLSCKKTEPQIKLTVDHIVPLSRGGTNFIENLQPLCKSCNSSKGCKTIDFKVSF